MALNPKISLNAAKAACDAIVDLIDGGGAGTAYLRIYDGSQPADPDTAVSTQTKLAEIALQNPAFNSAASGGGGGQATLQGVPLDDSSADATGTAAWFRIVDHAGAAILDGTVGTSGCDLNLVTTSLVVGEIVRVTSLTVTVTK